VTGITALLNDYRSFKQWPALGWINPWLYGRGSEGLTDITKGESMGCNAEGLGFPALEGWDPVRFTRLVTSSLST
jgi:tripeptidyl-peptidase-1